MKMLLVEGAVKKLGKRSFGPYTFGIHYAERVAILGPNGAGKSTLLKLIAGTHQPSAGRIVFNQRRLADWTLQALSENRAVLSQSNNFSFALPTRVVIGLGRVSRKYDPKYAQIVTQAAALLDVSHLLDRTIDTLSGGELARVHLARVVAQLWDVEQGFILMDEPIAAVDPGLQDQLLQTLINFACIRRHAVIAVMHDLNHALRYFNRLFLVCPTEGLTSVISGVEAKHALERLYKVRLSCLKDEQGDLVMVPLRVKTETK
jgi:iron complex transport system ATP-binding protein